MYKSSGAGSGPLTCGARGDERHTCLLPGTELPSSLLCRWAHSTHRDTALEPQMTRPGRHNRVPGPFGYQGCPGTGSQLKLLEDGSAGTPGCVRVQVAVDGAEPVGRVGG